MVEAVESPECGFSTSSTRAHESSTTIKKSTRNGTSPKLQIVSKQLASLGSHPLLMANPQAALPLLSMAGDGALKEGKGVHIFRSDVSMVFLLRGRAAPRLQRRSRTPHAWACPTNSPRWRCTSSKTRCSTARPFAWMAHCAWRRAEPPGLGRPRSPHPLRASGDDRAHAESAPWLSEARRPIAAPTVRSSAWPNTWSRMVPSRPMSTRVGVPCIA